MNAKQTPRAKRRSAASPCSAARWRRICKMLGPHYENTTARNVEMTLDNLLRQHRYMCARCQTVAQKYHLGLGGENIADVVCAEVERIHEPNK